MVSSSNHAFSAVPAVKHFFTASEAGHDREEKCPVCFPFHRTWVVSGGTADAGDVGVRKRAIARRSASRPIGFAR
jgi:hypothetical protein